MSISHHRLLAKYIRQAQTGDPEAFAELYQTLSLSAYYGVLRMVRNRDEALALTKEIMVEVCRNIQRLGTPEALVAFVNRMVYLRSIDFLRRGQRLSAQSEAPEEETSPEELEALLSENMFHHPNQVQDVLAAIDRLPDQYRAVILLYYYNGYSTEEMSKMLGWDESTTTTKFYRAHNALKLLLSSKEGGDPI